MWKKQMTIRKITWLNFFIFWPRLAVDLPFRSRPRAAQRLLETGRFNRHHWYAADPISTLLLFKTPSFLVGSRLFYARDDLAKAVGSQI